MAAIACAGAIPASAAMAPAGSPAAIRQEIVNVAAQQLGYHDHGDYCTRFGPCEEWCSLFLTWVWRQAGIPISSLAFTGYVYDWAQAYTSVQGPAGHPQPGDAVLFGTGPATPATSRHTGIVEAVYPGYLVTIEGDSAGGIRRYVVPLRNPRLVGEPGPIYAYASPLPGSAAVGSDARAAALARWRARPLPVTAHAARSHRTSLEEQRLQRAIVALRAFQHMPYRIGGASIDWTGITRRGLVEVRVTSSAPLADAQSAWLRFLARFQDAGHAYAVSFGVASAVPVDLSPPTITGSAVVGQTLTEGHGEWSGAPTSYTYRWEDCDSDGESCTAIPGATGPAYTLTAADAGYTIRVQETAANASGPGQPAAALQTALVATPASSSPSG